MARAQPPFRFAAAKGPHDARRLLDACVQQLGETVDGNLGFVYLTDALATGIDEIIDGLTAATGISAWVGAVGYGIVAGADEVYQQPALAVMCADLPKDGFRVFGTDWQDAQDFAARHGDWFEGRDAVFAQVHASPGNEPFDQRLEALAELLPAGFLAGGLASSEDGQAPHIAGRAQSAGLSGVLLDLEKVPLRVRHTQGCHPIGPRRSVDEAFRNILVKLDGRPALDVLKQDIGELLSRDLERSLATILAGLMVEGSDTGDYLARHLVGVEEQRGLVGVGDWVVPGSTLVFCRRDPEAARLDLKRMLEELTAGLDQPPRGALYAACVGRGRHMFGGEGVEMGLIREHLGAEVPVVGFLANGEIYHQRLYGYTGVLTLFL